MEELDLLQHNAAELDNELETIQPTQTPTDGAGEGGPVGVTGMDAAQSLQEASLFCNLAADGVHAIFPLLEYGPQTRQTAAEKLAPVLQKYSIGSELLARWSVEIDAAIFFGTLIYTSYAKVKAHKAAEKSATIDAQPGPVPGATSEPTQAGGPKSIYPETF